MTKSLSLKISIGACTFAMLCLGQSVGAATIYSDDLGGFYEPSLVQYVASKGSFPTVVIANPFGAETNDALLANMSLPANYPSVPLTATTTKARDDGHLVLIFNPVPTSNGDTACAAPASQSASGTAGGADVLRLLAAFCYDDEMASEAIMEMPRPSGIDDQSLDQAMAELMDALLPINSRHLIGGCVSAIAC
ncbi:MAG: hypothetical protein QGG19_19045 [Alphaproteobacteria bacterium]|jgi:hypothetical protein|nr:hypothetical protein [Rhodospirillaceae bacterium]MDP6023370.1 hypothetical protein [Alphaproteobacteria bacterium]MDP6255229.1 hypothetical protein [Alphaproteobacteria bacterium]MDP7053861.1 hypothetical protein [Alphaproteobacteria bacterium]MDP7227168.1 hypothetical protein [Alphaproteobacteria bacterium]|tara:strand:- start:2497 stop:3075 length:579 start_codon:yes stop_codon:yes gene_type:complete